MSNNNIALTASMRSNLLSLQNTQNLMNKTQDRLSTGYKVNSAMDNPSSYFTAQSLNSRANDLSSLLDSIGQAISTLEVADKGITTLQDFVEQAKSIANNARDTSNVPASTSSKVKFDTDTLRSALVTDQVNGLNTTAPVNPGDPEISSMTIRLGESTKLSGNKNVSDETTLNALGLEPAPAASVGNLSVGADKFDIIGGAAEAKMETGNSVTFSVGTNTSADTVSVFTVSNFNADEKTATLTDFDGNTYSVRTDQGDLSTLDFAGKDTLTITNPSAASGSSGTVTLTEVVMDNGKTKYELTLSGGNTSFAAATSNAHTAADAKGAVKHDDGDKKIYVKNGGTVEDMAKTLETMIGTDRISVSVENSNLQMKSLDTSSLEVKGTIADKFGLDKGTEIKLDASDTAESLRQKISNMKFDDGRTVTAEFDTDGHLVVKSTEGDDMVISGDLADKLGVSGSVSNGSNERAIYSKQFDAVLTQIDELVQDTSYKGINLLKGDNLTVNFNESRTSTIELKGVNFDATGLGFTQSANEWRGNADIDKALEQVTKATSMLRAQASEFGQNLSTVQIREDFTKNMINNLQAGADKLTLADMNEEAANMLSLQTRQQLGVNSLSLASQASQSVLKLF